MKRVVFISLKSLKIASMMTWFTTVEGLKHIQST